jgi:hypothetical protein
MEYLMGLPMETRQWIAGGMVILIVAIAILTNYMRRRHRPAKRWYGNHTYGLNSGRRLNRMEKVLARLRLI